MACVILPSETARLVYGYLVKENLNDIALKFLEKSPYLTDCYQIVKNGYQFNTKLMGKELQDLLQEYSVIHSLANKKINLLCKTSLLYKRIKLRCESLSEILELILFWKYRQSQNGVTSLTCEKNTKNLSAGAFKCNSDSLSIKTGTLNTNSSSRSCDNFSVNVSGQNSCLMHNNHSIGKLDNIKNNFSSETCDKIKEFLQNKVHSGELANVEEANKCKKQKETSLLTSSPISREFQKHSSEHENGYVSDKANTSCDNYNTLINNANESEIPELCFKTSVLTLNMNSHEKNFTSHKIASEQMETRNLASNSDSQIKIINAQKEGQNDENIANSFSANSNQTETNITLEGGSVVYVSPDVGNLAIDQERSQIIVIPIDYYKSQNEIISNVKPSDGQTKTDFCSHKKFNETQNKSNSILENVLQNEESPHSQFCSEPMNKLTPVDDNIMTENDFLKNKHLMFNLGKELIEKPDTQVTTQKIPKVPTDLASLPAVTAPLIVLSQTVLSNPKPSRYRSILPKKKEESVPSVVLVQPLLDSTQIASKKNKEIDGNRKKETNAGIKKKGPPLFECKKKKSPLLKTLDMPTIKTLASNQIIKKSKNEESGKVVIDSAETSTRGIFNKITREEKENLEKTDTEKIETPTFIAKRNSKRLSLSTPRRRSHIRALEFETPPKAKEEKKSKTSPKVKVDQMTLERKSVRNTLFKSPVPESSFRSPETGPPKKKQKEKLKDDFESNQFSPKDGMEPLNELSIPIATRSPNIKLSDAWENLTGVGCVIGQSKNSVLGLTKKMWDADLRCFLMNNAEEPVATEKKKIVKVHKSNRKNIRKKASMTKKLKTSAAISPSKMSLTSKRNTYSINGKEEGSPPRSLVDDVKMVTPFKDIGTIRASEETPLTKLLRENINTIDIDLSMINTPSFPPTPSILVTPDLDDMPLPGANYYSPSKDLAKENLVKVTDYIRVNDDSEKDPKEIHEKVIDDLVSKAKEIIGIGKINQEDSAMQRRPSGKILSMVKIQMLTQCDKKLCENIPINEEGSFVNGSINQFNSLSDSYGETIKSDLKEELEEKRKRALKKIKVVKENLVRSKNKVVVKRRQKRRGGSEFCSSNSSSENKPLRKRYKMPNRRKHRRRTKWSDENGIKKIEMIHSTPYDSKKHLKLDKSDTDKKEKDEILSDIRQQLPPYTGNDDSYPELTEKSRKKIHYVGHFLKLEEIVRFLEKYNETNPPKLCLKPSFRRFFQVFYKWLKHPHKHELNASLETKQILRSYLIEFNKINIGVNKRERRPRKFEGREIVKATKEELESYCRGGKNSGVVIQVSEEDEKDWKSQGVERKKDEDTEDGFISILPLKKRKQTVQRIEGKSALELSTTQKDDPKVSCSAKNASQAQNFLQDIDVDRFLSQIHGHSNS